MSAQTDGGPAFPHDVVIRYQSGETTVLPQIGMSLRDWLAGQALNGQMSHGGPAAEAACHLIASWAYEMADAMLVERAKQRRQTQ